MKITIQESDNTLTLDMPGTQITSLVERLGKMLPSIAEGYNQVRAAVAPAAPVRELKKFRCSVAGEEPKIEETVTGTDLYDAACCVAARRRPNVNGDWWVREAFHSGKPGVEIVICESAEGTSAAVVLEEIK